MKFFSRCALIGMILCAVLPAAGDSRLGADKAVPHIFAFFDTLPLVPGTVYSLNESETEKLISLAADIHINVFEVIDCAFRYLNPVQCRVSIDGELLRKLESRFNLGGSRVLAILAVEKIRYFETGAVLNKNQNDLDIFLSEPAETYIEIGTAKYDTHFGFRKMSPLQFEDAFGITVKKLLFSAPFTRLKLFAPGKGEIYVKGVPRPKRWNLDVITYID